MKSAKEIAFQVIGEDVEKINMPIGVSGKMGTGKTTLVSFFEQLGYVKFSMGDYIKKLCNVLIENKDFEDFINKILKEENKRSKAKKELIKLKEEIKGRNFKKIENDIYEKNDNYRNLTQKVGEILRKQGGDNVWVEYAIEQALKNGGKIICDDIRLKKEKEIFEKNGFKIIRLELEKNTQKNRVKDLYGEISLERFQNKTEVDLDEEVFDCTIQTSHYSKEEVFMKSLEFLSNKSSILKEVVSYVEAIPLGKRDDWEKYFMTQAFMVGTRSTCGSRRVGAVIVKNNHIVASGYNGYPAGEKHCIDGGCPRFLAKQQGLLKSGEYTSNYPCDAFHAEHNALNQLLKEPSVSTKDCEMYTTTFPCVACAKLIQGAGIKKVYYCKGYPDRDSKSYFDRYNIQIIKINI